MKTKQLFKRILCSLIAAACAASAAGCNKKEENKNSGKKNVAKKIVNYYSPTELKMPDGIENVDNIKYSNDKIYLSGSCSDQEGQNYTKILNTQTGEFEDIKLSEKMNYVTAASFNSDKLYICYIDDEGNGYLGKFSRQSGECENKIELDAQQYITSLTVNSDSSISCVSMKYIINTAETLLTTYDESLSVKDEKNISEKVDMGKDGYIIGVCSDKDGGYYAIGMSFTNGVLGTKVFRLNSSLDIIYTSDDQNDMGSVSKWYLAPNGNLMLISNDMESAAVMINEISKDDGSTVNRYEIEGAQTAGPGAGKYDIIYSDEKGLYGYTLATEEKVSIADYSGDFDQCFQYATMATSNDELFMNTTSYGSGSGMCIYVMDLQGQVLNQIDLSENQKSGSYVNSTYIDKSGKVYALQQSGGDEESAGDFSVMVYDENGEYEKSVDLNMSDIDSQTYIDNFGVKDDGSIIVSAQSYSDDKNSSQLISFSADGKDQTSIELNDVDYIDDILLTDDKDYAVYYDNATVIAPIDYENKKLGDKIDMSDTSLGSNAQIYAGNGTYDLYYNNEEAVYGYSIKDKKDTEIINWVDSDISISVQKFFPADDNTLVCSAYDTQDGVSKVYILNRVDEETLKNIQSREIITAAGINLGYTSLADKIKEFNKENDQYRIQYTDYSKYSTYNNDDYQSGAKKLNEDLIAGDIPDLILANSEIDMQAYTAKGLLTDLNTMLENDKDFNMDDYYKNIFDMYTVDSKLFELVTQFHIDTIIGKKSELGEPGWTVDEFLDFADSKPDGTMFYKESYDSLISGLIKNNLAEFVDFSNKSCDFDNEKFTGLLEFIKKNGTEEKNDADSKDDYGKEESDEDYNQRKARYKDNSCFSELLSMNDFESFNSLQQGDIGEEAVLKGLPCENGNGTLIVPDLSVGISEKSSKKEAAWSFVKQLLEDDYQDGINKEYTMDFPVKKSAMDKIVKNAQSDQSASGGYTEGPDGGYIEIKPIDSDSVNRILGVISDSTRHEINDDKINSIIDEQTESFIHGDVSAKEAAQTIQSKAALYLKEIS